MSESSNHSLIDSDNEYISYDNYFDYANSTGKNTSKYEQKLDKQELDMKLAKLQKNVEMLERSLSNTKDKSNENSYSSEQNFDKDYITKLVSSNNTIPLPQLEDVYSDVLDELENQDYEEPKLLEDSLKDESFTTNIPVTRSRSLQDLGNSKSGAVGIPITRSITKTPFTSSSVTENTSNLKTQNNKNASAKKTFVTKSNSGKRMIDYANSQNFRPPLASPEISDSDINSETDNSDDEEDDNINLDNNDADIDDLIKNIKKLKVNSAENSYNEKK